MKMGNCLLWFPWFFAETHLYGCWSFRRSAFWNQSSAASCPTCWIRHRSLRGFGLMAPTDIRNQCRVVFCFASAHQEGMALERLSAALQRFSPEQSFFPERIAFPLHCPETKPSLWLFEIAKASFLSLAYGVPAEWDTGDENSQLAYSSLSWCLDS